MATAHASHDWSETGFCTECACSVLALDARLKCHPSIEPEVQPIREIDYNAITRGLSMS